MADVELRSLSTTGGHQVWPAATHLLEYLSSHQSDAHCFVELGAGTGFLGLSLAMRRRGIHVVLSEQDLEEAQALLRDNLVKNHVKNAVVKVGDFFDLTRLPVIGQTDVLIIGSDLVYTREIAVAFPKFVCALIKANPGSSMLYCHTFRRYDFVDSLLLKQIAEEVCFALFYLFLFLLFFFFCLKGSLCGGSLCR